MLAEQTLQVIHELHAADADAIEDWHVALGHLDFDLARRAARAATANPTIDRVEPKHVLAHAASIAAMDAREAGAPRSYKTGPAPMPRNFKAMMAAADPVSFAREKAIYNQQLIDEGYPPLYEVQEHTR